MKKVALTNIKVNSLNEIFQSLDIKFAFVNKKMEEISVPAKCRDFLGDCIYSKRMKKPVAIYGFKYDFQKTPFDACRFSLKFPDLASKNNFIKNLDYLNGREIIAGIKQTKVFETQHKLTLVVEGSNYWVSNVWKVSYYTFLLKVISYPSVSDLQQPEKSYIKSLTPEIEQILLSKVKKERKELLHKEMYVAHDNLGFISLIKGYAYHETKQNHALIFG